MLNCSETYLSSFLWSRKRKLIFHVLEFSFGICLYVVGTCCSRSLDSETVFGILSDKESILCRNGSDMTREKWFFRYGEKISFMFRCGIVFLSFRVAISLFNILITRMKMAGIELHYNDISPIPFYRIM